VGRCKWRAFVMSWRGSMNVAGFRRVVAWVAASGGLSSCHGVGR
jgi:hypothetical protein